MSLDHRIVLNKKAASMTSSQTIAAARNDQGGKSNSCPLVPYTVPGVVCFLQHEWTKMEAERQAFDLQKAEYEAKIKLLTGEVQALRGIKSLLTRRITMLEYALKRECQANGKQQMEENGVSEKPENDRTECLRNPDAESSTQDVQNVVMRGKQLIKQFLDEMGCVEDLIDARCDRLRFALQDKFDEKFCQVEDSIQLEQRLAAAKAKEEETNSSAHMSNENFNADNGPEKTSDVLAGSAMNAFNFLSDCDVLADGNEQNNSWDDADNGDNTSSSLNEDNTSWPSLKRPRLPNDHQEKECLTNQNNPFGGLGTVNEDLMVSNDRTDSLCSEKEFFDRQIARMSRNMPESCDYVEEADDRFSSDVKHPCGKQPLTINCLEQKSTLYGHLDVVRCVAIHTSENLILTGSDDHTAKLWIWRSVLNLERHNNTECPPLLHYTIRKHSCCVRCVGFGPKSYLFYTADNEGKICIWNMESLSCEDSGKLQIELFAELPTLECSIVCLHAVEFMGILLAACTDRTLQTWFVDKCDTGNVAHPKPLCTSEAGVVIKLMPTRRQCDLVLAFNTAWFAKWSTIAEGMSFVQPPNQLALHIDENCSMNDAFYLDDGDSETVIGAFDNGKLLWFDLNHGQIMRSLMTHDGAVSAVIEFDSAVLTFGYDGIARVWGPKADGSNSFDLLQERRLHRQKADEAITDVHVRKRLFATAGADGQCKLFLWTGARPHQASAADPQPTRHSEEGKGGEHTDLSM